MATNGALRGQRGRKGGKPRDPIKESEYVPLVSDRSLLLHSRISCTCPPSRESHNNVIFINIPLLQSCESRGGFNPWIIMQL